MKKYTFDCCCDAQFKRIYGHIIRTLKRQYKNRFKELTLGLREQNTKMEIYFSRSNYSYNWVKQRVLQGCCAKCISFNKPDNTSRARFKTVSIQGKTITLEINND